MDIMKLIPDNAIDLILIDPPYGIEYSSNGGPRVSKERKTTIAQETKIKNDNYVNSRWFSELFRTLKSDGAMYCFCSWNSFSVFEGIIKSCGFKIKTPLIWDKGNCGMGDLKGDYGNKTEIIIYAVKGKHILKGNRDRNIITFQRPSDAHRLHPTQKPVKLYEYLIEKSSNENDIVLDSFSGSGTTAVACKNKNRRFICIENDEEYVKISNQRLNGI